MANQQLSTNTFGVTKWIVSATASDGTHTTIAAALTAASSGDTIFIRPGTYTENPTLKAGVNLTAFESDSSLNGTGNVIISGKCTFTAAGSVTISGIQLQTNSDFFLAVTGSAASIVNLNNCYLNALNNTGISFTSSSPSAQINAYHCTGNIGTIGISLYSSSATGLLVINFSVISNSGASTTSSSNSAGTISAQSSNFAFPISTSSTGTISFVGCILDTSPTNTTTVTTAGSTTGNTLRLTTLNSGSASTISVGAGNTVAIDNSQVGSTNTNAITGSGTIIYSGVTFFATSATINTTTKITKTLRPQLSVNNQVFTTTGTYTPTPGMIYCSIQCLGGGGGGGGALSTAASQYSIAGGGGSGEYAVGIFTVTNIGASQAVTIGAAGAANSGSAGGTGGNTSVGALISSNGGNGGTSGAADTSSAALGGAGGTGGSGGDYRTPGAVGLAGSTAVLTAPVVSGAGANSQLGSGGAVASIGTAAVGNAAAGYGAGGSGAFNSPSLAAKSGGAGTAGIVIVTEYILT